MKSWKRNQIQWDINWLNCSFWAILLFLIVFTYNSGFRIFDEFEGTFESKFNQKFNFFHLNFLITISTLLKHFKRIYFILRTKIKRLFIHNKVAFFHRFLFNYAWYTMTRIIYANYMFVIWYSNNLNDT